ncbi:hypothetical protein ARMGADRAFT_1037185 [Armillaria gallica]|uniref:Uncharacterized protein n=1 Tax=Armillaria gallica TaxID=47427 RepID=A0A2H3CN21_ARMGA|nr:hypothetical protein ARMGADRAFT_1037185 [Armillaria gallica]
MLPLEDVWSFSVVSRSARERVHNYFTEHFDFNNTMQPWFSNDDAVLLRQLMERTGAVITGSTSIAFFDRKVAEITDLNIIVGIEGSVETACAENTNGPHDAKVIITVAIYSAIDVILHSHSTLAMNIITSSHAVSLCPKLSFMRREGMKTNMLVISHVAKATTDRRCTLLDNTTERTQIIAQSMPVIQKSPPCPIMGLHA